MKCPNFYATRAGARPIPPGAPAAFVLRRRENVKSGALGLPRSGAPCSGQAWRLDLSYSTDHATFVEDGSSLELAQNQIRRPHRDAHLLRYGTSVGAEGSRPPGRLPWHPRLSPLTEPNGRRRTPCPLRPARASPRRIPRTKLVDMPQPLFIQPGGRHPGDRHAWSKRLHSRIQGSTADSQLRT